MGHSAFCKRAVLAAIQYLYHDLYNLPSKNNSVDPDIWKGICPCLDSKITFTVCPPGTMLPVAGTTVSVRHLATPPLDDLNASFFLLRGSGCI